MINKRIFREYDIRDKYPDYINEGIAYEIGRSYGSYLRKSNVFECLHGFDNRLSSSSLSDNMIMGILDSGVNVINMGYITTPMIYTARHYLNVPASMMVTASHNPGDDNGFKFSFDTEGNVKGKTMESFKDFVFSNERYQGNGVETFKYYEKEYIKLLLNNIKMGHRKLRVVIDSGNGITSVYVKNIFSEIGIEDIYICDFSDGTFPNHHPDPSVESNMEMLKNKVLEVKADLGIAFDGDGDRIGMVDEKGRFWSSDIFSCLYVKDILKTSSDKRVLLDIKCSKTIRDVIAAFGGEPVDSRSGASFTMSGVIDNNLVLGVEYSGHIYFNDRKLFPNSSGIYAGLRLIEILSKSDKKMSEMLDELPLYYKADEIRIESADNKKGEVIDKIKEYVIANNITYNDLDGVKAYFDDGWALIRCSNTGPYITCIFEFETKERLDIVMNDYLDLINSFNN